MRTTHFNAFVQHCVTGTPQDMSAVSMPSIHGVHKTLKVTGNCSWVVSCMAWTKQIPLCPPILYSPYDPYC